MNGLAELRVKESDRLDAIADVLSQNGVEVETGPDHAVVRGAGDVPGGGTVATRLDHRIAMSALVLGLSSKAPVAIDDGATIRSSFTSFVDDMRRLGADIRALEPAVAQ